MTRAQKFETTFRMDLKGANHFLFDEEIIIRKIYHDYSSETPFEEEFNIENITGRLVEESCSHINFDTNFGIETISKNELTSILDNHNILQLTDVIIGSIRTKLINQKFFVARFDAASSYNHLLPKEVENTARMRYSRFYKGYTFTNASIRDNKWHFTNMKIERNIATGQFKLVG